MKRLSRGRRAWWLFCDIAVALAWVVFWVFAVIVLAYIAMGMVP